MRSRSTTSAPRCSSPASRCCWSGSRSPATSSAGSPPPARCSSSAGWPIVAAAVYVEARVAVEPIIPLRLFRDRTTSLATGASVLVGVAMFGVDRLPQPVLPARPRDEPDQGRPDVGRDGRRPAGLEHRHRPDHQPRPASGSATSSAAWSPSSSASRCWRRSTRRPPLGWSVPSWRVLGLGLGATMQNLSSPSRTTSPSPTSVPPARWSRSSARSAASIGVSALGAVLSHQVAASVTRRPRPALGIRSAPTRAARSPTWRRCPRRCARVFEHAFGEATGHLFLVAVPFAVLALVCVAVHPRGAAAHHDPARGRDLTGVAAELPVR